MHSTKPKTLANCVSSPNVANAFGPASWHRQSSVGRRQQVRLADTEAAVEVHADTGQRPRLPNSFCARRGCAPPRRRRPGETTTAGLRGLVRIGPVALEADIGEGRRDDQLRDQPRAGDTVGCRSTR